MKRGQTLNLLLYNRRCCKGRCRACRRFWCAALAAMWALTGLPAGRAQGSRRPEYEVKAAYLFNFGNFVVWPAKSADPMGDSFPICVLGQDPFGPMLDATVTGEMIGGRKVVARRISRPQEALNCRIVFVSSSEEGQLKEVVSSLGKLSVLTVSDIPEFAQRGGMVQFVLEQNRVRFEINQTSAERAGMTLSSQLLKLATKVRKNPQPGE